MLSKLPEYIERETPTARGVDAVVSNALYENFLVHARVLDEFLSNGGDDRTVKARDYVEGWVVGDPQPQWRRHANQRVSHLDWKRTSPGGDGPLNVDAKEIRGELGARLWAFYEALPDVRKAWFIEIRDSFAPGASK
jgi:hypothetical protein